MLICYAAELRDNMKCPLFLQPITTTTKPSGSSHKMVHPLHPRSSSTRVPLVSTMDVLPVVTVDMLLGPKDGLESTIPTDLEWRSQLTDVRSFAAYKCALYDAHAPFVDPFGSKRANKLCKWALKVAPYHPHWILSLQAELGTPDGQDLIDDCVFNADWVLNQIKFVAQAECMSRPESDKKASAAGEDSSDILFGVYQLRQTVATMKYYIAESRTGDNRMNGMSSIIGWRRTSTIEDTFDPFAYCYYLQTQQGTSYERDNKFYGPIVTDLIQYMNGLHGYRSACDYDCD
jgi:hypothetical protein